MKLSVKCDYPVANRILSSLNRCLDADEKYDFLDADDVQLLGLLVDVYEVIINNSLVDPNFDADAEIFSSVVD